jgi:hypothetical protein
MFLDLSCIPLDANAMMVAWPTLLTPIVQYIMPSEEPEDSSRIVAPQKSEK